MKPFYGAVPSPYDDVRTFGGVERHRDGTFSWSLVVEGPRNTVSAGPCGGYTDHDSAERAMFAWFRSVVDPS